MCLALLHHDLCFTCVAVSIMPRYSYVLVVCTWLSADLYCTVCTCAPLPGRHARYYTFSRVKEDLMTTHPHLKLGFLPQNLFAWFCLVWLPSSRFTVAAAEQRAKGGWEGMRVFGTKHFFVGALKITTASRITMLRCERNPEIPASWPPKIGSVLPSKKNPVNFEGKKAWDS